MRLVKAFRTRAILLCTALTSACNDRANKDAADTPAQQVPLDAKVPAAAPAAEPKAEPEPPAAPAAAPTAEPNYTAELDPLLDLLPAKPEGYAVVRDPMQFIDGFAWLIGGQQLVWTAILDRVRDPAKPEEDVALRKLLLEFDAIRTALVSSGLHLDRGIAFAKVSGQTFAVLSADDPEMLPKLLRSLSPKPDEVTMQCTAVPRAAGFIVCGGDAKTVSTYAPAFDAKTLRANAIAKLDAESVARANLLTLSNDDDDDVAFAIMTAPGVMQTDVRIPEADKLAALRTSGAASLLGALTPGHSFAWLRADVDTLAKSADGPEMVRTIVRALSGEVLMASPGTAPGITLLFGLTDPTPVAGLIPMASLAKDSLKALPDGTTLDLKVEEVDDGKGGKLQTLRVRAGGSGEAVKLAAQGGLPPEVTAFVTKELAAISVGSGAEIVPLIVGGSTGGPSKELLAELPAGLAKALEQGKTWAVMHVEFDALHAPGLREALIAAMPPESVGATDELKFGIDATLALMSPLSSMSMWGTDTGDGKMVHVALRSFGDPVSAEGKAAQAARLAVLAKTRDAATAYGALASAYPDSRRLTAYRARSGQTGLDGAKSGASVMGVLAAIAVPAMSKYVQRSKAAALEARSPK